MMMILGKMGLQIGGSKFLEIQEQRGQQNRNPDGYWEIAWLPFTGLHQDILDGEREEVTIPEGSEVIKLATAGLLVSDFRLIDAVVFCIRDPREVIVSQRRQINWPGDDKNYRMYNDHMCQVFKFFKPQAWLDTVCLMDYGRLMKNPEGELQYLGKFLGKLVTPGVSKLIRPELYRSKAKKVRDNKTARKYYDTLISTMEAQRTYW